MGCPSNKIYIQAQYKALFDHGSSVRRRRGCRKLEAHARSLPSRLRKPKKRRSSGFRVMLNISTCFYTYKYIHIHVYVYVNALHTNAYIQFYQHKPPKVWAEMHGLNSCKLFFFRVAYCAISCLVLAARDMSVRLNFLYGLWTFYRGCRFSMFPIALQGLGIGPMSLKI